MILFTILTIIIIMVLAWHFSWRPNYDSTFYNDVDVLWFAHRGALLSAPENTLDAFSQAVEAGLPALEVDVMSTQDGMVIASHNFDLEYGTNGFGYVHKMNYQDIKDIKVFGPKGTSPAPMLLLDELFAEISSAIKLNVDIKTAKKIDLKTAYLVVKKIKNERLYERVMISSFNPLTLLAVKLFDNKILTAFITQYRETIPFVYFSRADFIHPHASLVDDTFLRFARRKNLRINTWTVNTRPAVEWLTGIGVDGIITDRLEFCDVYK